MKKIPTFLIAFCIAGFVHAQQIGFKLTSGKILRDKITERTVDISSLGNINGYSYFLYHPFIAVFNQVSVGSTENFYIGKFDKNLNLVKRAEIELKQDKKELTCEGVLRLKDECIVFSSFQNTKDKKHYLFAQNFDFNSLQLVPNIKLIGELDYSSLNKYNNTVFHYEISADSSKVLVFYTLLSKKNETLNTGMYVFNQEMKLLWKNLDVTAKFAEGVFEYDRFRVDNEGNVYLLGKHYADKDNYYDAAHFRDRGFFSNDVYYTDKPNYSYELYKYTANDQNADIHPLSIPGKFIRSLSFTPTGNNSIFCFGMYAKSEKISVEGGFAFTYDLTTKQVIGLSTKEMSKELLSQDLDPTELKRFRRSIDNKQEWDPFAYILDKVKTKSNGDRYFIAEQYIGGTKTERSGNMTIYSAIHMHNDLYVVNLNSDNQITRIDKLHKRQYWLNTDTYNSYSSIEKNGNLYFIYNSFEASESMFKNIDVGNSYIARLDANGKEQKSIFRKKEDKDSPMPMPRTGILQPDHSIIFSLMTFNYKDYQVQRINITE